MNRVHASPARFTGTLGEFYDLHVAAILPPVEAVVRMHEHIREYCALGDPLFLVRKVSSTKRSEDHSTDEGCRFRATDNSPAWWTYSHVHANRPIGPSEFADLIRRVPCDMLRADSAVRAINLRGWHVAHIFNVKDGHTSWRQWSRRDLERRFVRNVHPCNQFYFAKSVWTKYGERNDVKAFFAEKYRERYQEVWPEFLSLAQGGEIRPDPHARTLRVEIPVRGFSSDARSPRRWSVGVQQGSRDGGPLDGIDLRRRYSQRDMMRELYRRHVGSLHELYEAYDLAERAGLVDRESNVRDISGYEYAQYLYLDGMAKGWLL